MYEVILKNSVLYPAPGNHDYGNFGLGGGSLGAPFYSIFTLPDNAQAGGYPSGTEQYYSWNYGNVHFICLDSHLADKSTTGAMATWLTQDLAANTLPWVIVYWHHPPYTKGSHDSDLSGSLAHDYAMGQMRSNILPILENSGVDLVLAGHSHSYERSFLIDGHYGLSNTLTIALNPSQNPVSSVQISPNPVQSGEDIHVFCTATEAIYPLYVSVLDLRGKILYKSDFSLPQGQQVLDIPTSSLGKGVHIIQIQTDKFNSIHKVLVE